jgi:hypothetical protein
MRPHVRTHLAVAALLLAAIARADEPGVVTGPVAAALDTATVSAANARLHAPPLVRPVTPLASAPAPAPAAAPLARAGEGVLDPAAVLGQGGALGQGSVLGQGGARLQTGSFASLPPTSIPELTGRREDDDFEAWRRVALPAVEVVGLNVSMMTWNRYVGESSWASVNWDTIGSNLRHEWVLDNDNIWINNFGHPYMGTYAQTAARSAGLGFWASALYPIAMSTQWELAGETEPPSINDQITTPMAGIVLGEALFRFSDALRYEGGWWRNGLAAFLAPFGAVNARAVRRAPRPAPGLRWQVAMGSISGDATGGGWGSGAARPWGSFSVVWGRPGDPDLDPSRPFDHFVLESGYEAAGDPAATVRVRGLVLGDGLEWGRSTRGLWGMFLSYDFDTTGPYRVSTSAVGVGASTRTELSRGLDFEGTAIASAVLMGAAGNLDKHGDAMARDYRFGPGQQALLEGRLIADDRIAGALALRQYLVVGDGPGNGAEMLLEGTARVTLWLTGPHAIGAEYSQYFRRSDDDGGGGKSGSEGVVRFYWAIAKG